MPTIFDATRQKELVDRAARLKPEAPARWGKFNATRMLSHVNDALRMALADLPVRSRKTPFKNAFARLMIIHLLPFPKGAPTAPELLARGDKAEFEAERTAFAELVARVGACKDNTSWPEHPAFGPMTQKDWGVLGYKHVHHHFSQFGI